ncbi:hypothetical protein POKO110462_19420 [Pontibacter korlensis]
MLLHLSRKIALLFKNNLNITIVICIIVSNINANIYLSAS